MAALNLAMLAKLGEVTIAEAEGLVGRAQTLLPTDERVAEAAAHFAALVCAGDPREAGTALHDFVIDWSASTWLQVWAVRKVCGHD
jgi:hypothetical protein